MPRILRLEPLPRELAFEGEVNAYPLPIGWAEAEVLRVDQNGILVLDAKDPKFDGEGQAKEMVLLYFVLTPRYARSTPVSQEMGRHLGSCKINGVVFEVFESALQALRRERKQATAMRARGVRAKSPQPARE